jgi:hypothetical protein
MNMSLPHLSVNVSKLDAWAGFVVWTGTACQPLIMLYDFIRYKPNYFPFFYKKNPTKSCQFHPHVKLRIIDF